MIKYNLFVDQNKLWFQKQVAQFAKVVSHVWEIISKGREDWEGESMRSAGICPYILNQPT